MTKQDQYSDLPLTRQQKWRLRNPDKSKAIMRRYDAKRNRTPQRQEYQRSRRTANKPLIKPL